MTRAIYSTLLTFFIGIIFFTSCEKADSLKVNSDGENPVLTVSSTGKTASYNDSSVAVLNLTWTDPGYAQDKSLYKYYIEVSSDQNSFSNAVILNTGGDGLKRSRELLGFELNKILLDFGYNNSSTQYDIFMRLVSSYGNNNEQRKSSIVKVSVLPYQLPKVPVPVKGDLWLIGAASEGGWNLPYSDPYLSSQKFTRLNATTYELTLFLEANKQYLVIPEMTNDITDKFVYALPTGTVPSSSRLGGDFVFEKAKTDQRFQSPLNEGEYKLTFDFMTGKFTLTPQ